MGKARSQGDTNDYIKASLDQARDNFGVQRTNYQGTGQERGTTTGVGIVDPDSKFKLDIRGGIMKGALGRKGIATSELAVDGIIDMTIYHIPRLYITNTALNTLKVIIPSLGDGQEVWLRANGGVSFSIQNTSGTGDETTGNIECMAGSNYTMAGDDWVCFHYDVSDLKWHQVTAGKQNISGGSGGEVFTWSASHSANSFNLTTLNAITFAAGGSITGSVGSIIHNVDSGFNHNFAVASSTQVSIASTGITSAVPLAFIGVGISGATSLSMQGAISCNTNNISSIGRTTYGSGNYIQSNSTGDFHFATGSSNDDHVFFCGSAFFRLDGSASQADFFVPLLMQNNGIFLCTKIESGTGSGSQLNLSTGINLDSATSLFQMSDSSGIFLTAFPTGIQLVRDTDPFDDDTYSLGNSSHGYKRVYCTGGYAIQDYYAAGTAPSTVTGYATLFVRDSGAGKMQLRVKFGSTTSQLILEET